MNRDQERGTGEPRPRPHHTAPAQQTRTQSAARRQDSQERILFLSGLVSRVSDLTTKTLGAQPNTIHNKMGFPALALAAALALLAPQRAAADAPSLSCGAGLCFASGIGSGMVLQQAPARAALYGSVPAGSPAGAAVTVSLNASDGSYAKTFSAASAADGTWKVLLDAMPGSDVAGGVSFRARADCAACAGGGASSNTLVDVLFGDVFFCSGQSNSEYARADSPLRGRRAPSDA